MDHDNNKEPKLDALTATMMLEDIFAESEIEPNSLPLEALETQTAYRRRRVSVRKVILIAVLVIWLLLPVMFLSPRYEVELAEAQDRDLPVYTIEVKPGLPVRQVEAELAGEPIRVYMKEEGKNYAVEPERNGTLEIRITAMNRQTTVKRIAVTAVDETAPKLISGDMDDAAVYLQVQDEGSGVDYENIYGVTASGDLILPEKTDSEQGSVVFGIPGERWDIYVPDKRGNALHLSMDPAK